MQFKCRKCNGTMSANSGSNVFKTMQCTHCSHKFRLYEAEYRLSTLRSIWDAVTVLNPILPNELYGNCECCNYPVRVGAIDMDTGMRWVPKICPHCGNNLPGPVTNCECKACNAKS